MAKNAHKVALSFSLISMAYALIWCSWILGHQIILTVIVMAGALWGISRINQSIPRPLASAPSAPSLANKFLDTLPPSGWIKFFLCLVGLACVGIAYHSLLTEHWTLLVAMLGASAIAWSLGLPLQLPKISRPTLTSLLCLSLLSGAAFRLYKGGEIPVGFCSLDEAAIKMFGQSILAGQRPTMNLAEGVGDGTVPHYIEALGMKIFGTSLDGFRMSSLLIGILITFIMFHVGRDSGDPWMGLAAAFLWAMCLWPVSISRANYLLIETYLVVLLCLFFLIKAIKQDRAAFFALAGLFWAFSFQVYHAAEVMLALVPLLLFLVFFLQPNRRNIIYRGLIPLFAGLLVGLGPLLLWAWTDPADAYVGYFGVIYSGHVGAMPTSLGPLKALDQLLGHVIPCFPATAKLLTVQGPVNAYFFPGTLSSPSTFPLFNQTVIYLFLLGMAVCAARFRNPYFAFILFWWFVALLPGLVALPQPEDRRSMMLLLPTLFLAAIGFVTSLDFLLGSFSAKKKMALFLAAGLGFFSYLAVVSWNDYFVRNQQDSGFLNYNWANTVKQVRTIVDQDKKNPITLIATEDLNFSDFSDPNFDCPTLIYGALCNFPIQFTQRNQDYYMHDGLFGSLTAAANQAPDASGHKRDILVALTPFHFYLEPLLHQLGGQTVSEISLIKSNQGDLLQGVGMSPPLHGLSMKLIRFHNFQASSLDAMQSNCLFNFTAETLIPPGKLTRESIAKESSYGPEIMRRLSAYEASPASWKTTSKVNFQLPDPWFWMPPGNISGGMIPPMRLRVSFKLTIDSPGLYAFGASSTPELTLKLNGKRIFRFVPSEVFNRYGAAEFLSKERDGLLGEPIYLKAGTYRLDAEQVWLSSTGIWNHVFRLIWEKPGGTAETLPLEILKPVPAS